MKNWKMTKMPFYILSYTWGLPLTLIGLAIAGVLRLFGYKPKKWGGSTYFIMGKNWGAFSIGTTIVVSESCNDECSLNHEFGHSIQNCYFGFLCPFIVSIPSFVRATYRTAIVRLGIKKHSELPDYYSIWFERQASVLGDINIGYYVDADYYDVYSEEV